MFLSLVLISAELTLYTFHFSILSSLDRVPSSQLRKKSLTFPDCSMRLFSDFPLTSRYLFYFKMPNASRHKNPGKHLICGKMNLNQSWNLVHFSQSKIPWLSLTVNKIPWLSRRIFSLILPVFPWCWEPWLEIEDLHQHLKESLRITELWQLLWVPRLDLRCATWASHSDTSSHTDQSVPPTLAILWNKYTLISSKPLEKNLVQETLLCINWRPNLHPPQKKRNSTFKVL